MSNRQTSSKSPQWLAASRNPPSSSPAPASAPKAASPTSARPAACGRSIAPSTSTSFSQAPTAATNTGGRSAKCTASSAAAQPNAGHQVLARWEAAGRIRGVITQNIDGLHQMAGSRRVLELHGTARQAACLDCSRPLRHRAARRAVSAKRPRARLPRLRRPAQARHDLVRPMLPPTC